MRGLCPCTLLPERWCMWQSKAFWLTRTPWTQPGRRCLTMPPPRYTLLPLADGSVVVLFIQLKSVRYRQFFLNKRSPKINLQHRNLPKGLETLLHYYRPKQLQQFMELRLWLHHYFHLYEKVQVVVCLFFFITNKYTIINSNGYKYICVLSHFRLNKGFQIIYIPTFSD